MRPGVGQPFVSLPLLILLLAKIRSYFRVSLFLALAPPTVYTQLAAMPCIFMAKYSNHTSSLARLQGKMKTAILLGLVLMVLTTSLCSGSPGKSSLRLERVLLKDKNGGWGGVA